jgi:lipid II:glycine glycyltransferase (peptidoglycan interpeptide bridge formation enzyme)
MLITERKISIFKVKEYWFCSNPVDVSDCDSVIFHECGSKIKKDGFECTEFKTLTIDLTQDLDMIWSKFSKKSCKYELKRADRDGVNVYKTTNPLAFSELNKSFRQLKGLSGNVSVDYMQKYGTLFVAFIKNEFVAGQLYLEDRDNIRWLFGASKRLESINHLIGSANRALIFGAIRYAKCKGIKEFDFGGYYDGEDNPELQSISFFKKSFGGEVVTKYDYTKNYSKLYTLAKLVKGLIS